ncbi:unnamed protein product [Lactuca saligna]|uniref:GOLD domain-containing protein n=1 Tax=Lactuca saligna TaxID=75948 RepID=A0AA35Z0I9_LACSI|nr:unnamed protein product [Lactuca saligna]
MVKGPKGEQIYDFREKTSGKSDFVVHNEGVYEFCFSNKSPYMETVDFDVHSSHFYKDVKHAQNDHFNSIMEQISKLGDALHKIQFEQHWLQAQADRHAIINEKMSKRAMHKALGESAALIGASILQVYLLKRLFERKIGIWVKLVSTSVVCSDFCSILIVSVFQRIIRNDSKMRMSSIAIAAVFMVILTANIGEVFGIRFVIDRDECFSHKSEYGATVRFSFVVIKVEGAWHYNEDGVDLVVTGPKGEQIQDFRDKTSDKSDFVAHNEGLYKFCFTNKSPYHETLDFDVHSSHFYNDVEHAKDDHFKPILEQISKLEDALYNIQFEQHWLEAETDRQAIINEGMGKRAMHKAVVESAALIGASVLQVYLLTRLFERKLGLSRV